MPSISLYKSRILKGIVAGNADSGIIQARTKSSAERREKETQSNGSPVVSLYLGFSLYSKQRLLRNFLVLGKLFCSSMIGMFLSSDLQVCEATSESRRHPAGANLPENFWQLAARVYER